MIPQEKLCKCGHGERDHLSTCFACACARFIVDPRTITLAEHLENVATALEGALDEINSYKGRDRKTEMPVWVSGHDFEAHKDFIGMLDRVGFWIGKLKTGTWNGRQAQ